MRRALTYMLCAVLLLTATSCLKNELTLTGSLTEGKGQTLRILYRAADKEKSFLVDNPVPLDASGRFTLKAATRYPTVLWIYSMQQGELLMPVYAERGDELTLSGKYTEPWGWKVEGNKVMEQYGEWSGANAKALKSGDESQINAAVAAYVKKEPDTRTAAFILFTRFNVPGHEDEYRSLVTKLELDDDELQEMKQACLAPEAAPRGGNADFGTLRLPSPTDTLTSVSPAGRRSTLVCFWRDTPQAEMQALLREVGKDTLRQVVSVYMDTDTVRWHRALREDSVLGGSTALWALGGEVNPSVRPLGVAGTPWLMVVDAKGKILYGGADPKEARKKVYPK